MKSVQGAQPSQPPLRPEGHLEGCPEGRPEGHSAAQSNKHIIFLLL